MADYDGYDDGDGSTTSAFTTTTEGISAYFALFAGLLALVLVLSKLLHDRPVLGAMLPEAGMILIVGILGGAFINLFVTRNNEPAEAAADDDQAAADNDGSVAETLLSFSPNVFFIALLPPIIFNSGYHIRRELFFRHLVPIVLFSVVGTLISALTIAFLLDAVVGANLTGNFRPHLTELLTFGALISATDPVSTLAVFQTKRVDPHLFYLVFGESVLNDAMGLVLFKAFAKFVVVPDENGAVKVVFEFGEFIVSFLFDAVGSPLLGWVCGVAAALLFKHVDMRRSKLLELSLYVLIMYVPFLLAETVHLSGIVTILFTGMTARSFVVPNLSPQTAVTAETFFRLAAHLAETSIFLELGLSVFGLTKESFCGKFILWALLACLLARALNVYPLTFVFNRMLQRDPDHLDMNHESSTRNKAESPVHIEMSDALALSDHHRAEAMYHDPANNGNINKGDDDIQRQDTDLSSITPRQSRDMKIQQKTATMLWFSGLRGAVAYACSRSFPNTFGHRNEFVVATMAIVLVTVFCMGGTTELTLSLLHIHVNVDEDKYMEEWHAQRKPDGRLRRLDAFVDRLAVRRDGGDGIGADAAAAISEEDDDEERRSTKSDSSGNYYYHHHQQQPPIDESSASAHFADAEAAGNIRPTLEKKESLFDFGWSDFTSKD